MEKKVYTKPAVRKITLQRNDPCGCGSGKKFKNCCQKYAVQMLQQRVMRERSKVKNQTR